MLTWAPLEDPLGTIWAQSGKKVPFWAERHEKLPPMFDNFPYFSTKKSKPVLSILLDPPKCDFYIFWVPKWSQNEAKK